MIAGLRGAEVRNAPDDAGQAVQPGVTMGGGSRFRPAGNEAAENSRSDMPKSAVWYEQ